MNREKCPIINAIGDWVIRSINLGGYIFGDLHNAVKLKNIQAQARPTLPSETVRQGILTQMTKPPITQDSTPVAQ